MEETSTFLGIIGNLCCPFKIFPLFGGGLGGSAGCRGSRLYSLLLRAWPPSQTYVTAALFQPEEGGESKVRRLL